MQATVKFRKDNAITWFDGSRGYGVDRATNTTGDFLREKGFSLVNVWDDSVDLAPNAARHIKAAQKRVESIAKRSGLKIAVPFQQIEGRWGAVLCN